MFAFLSGIFVTLAFFAVKFKRGRLHGGPFSKQAGQWRARRQARIMGFLFRRLKTTPQQEREIQAAWDDFQAESTQWREKAHALKSNFVEQLYTDDLDETKMDNQLDQSFESMAEAKTSLKRTYGRIFRVLNPAQRRALGEIIRGRHHRHGYNPLANGA